MSTSHTPLSRQAGVLLIEALIGILIFSFGILAIIGMQAVAVKQVTDAQYRAQAGTLASQLLGQMWSDNRTASNLQTKYDSDNASASASVYPAWKAKVAQALPGADKYPPIVQVTSDGSQYDGSVVITVKWVAPSEPDQSHFHQYVVAAQIK